MNRRLSSAIAIVTAATVVSAGSAAAQQLFRKPRIVHRIYIGYLIPIDQDIGISGTLRSTDGSCTFTLQPSTFENPDAGRGPQGGLLMKGSGSCKGMFELDLYPNQLGNANNLEPYNPSDYGDSGRFDIESVTLSTIPPPGRPRYRTITTGTYTKLQSFPKPGDLGGSAGPIATMLDGITTTAPIN
jgi:hypothetical protein